MTVTEKTVDDEKIVCSEITVWNVRQQVVRLLMDVVWNGVEVDVEVGVDVCPWKSRLVWSASGVVSVSMITAYHARHVTWTRTVTSFRSRRFNPSTGRADDVYL